MQENESTPDLQYFPTPPALAKRLYDKFRNRNFVRLLDPQAGEGHLVADIEQFIGYDRRPGAIDCCEIDISKHPILRDKGLDVVGVDFLQFGDGSIYSHVVMNPPFATGVKHLLKAWSIVWQAEIGCVLNAESIRNPYTAERRQVVDLIDKFGEVEFVTGAFAGDDAEVKTDVEVALVHLNKEANLQEDIFGDLLSDLRQDRQSEEALADGYVDHQDVALPNSFIENSVLAFNAAVRAMRDAVKAEARASYYKSLLGATMSVRNGGDTESPEDTSVKWVQSTMGKRYRDLKDRAWSQLLRCTEVTSKLSSAAQKRIEGEFDSIKRLEFSTVNCYGFLLGLAQSQGEVQLDMMCDIFDLISRYHTDNVWFVPGWRSNDLHRTAGMKIKGTRFILPRHNTESYHTSFRYETEQVLRDLDKVFALLDGRTEPEIGLVEISRSHFHELRNEAARVTSSYFDLRYYPGASTLHFFPKRRDLIDRLNRVVGTRRRWLPPQGTKVSDSFWLAYESAERYDKEIRAEVNRAARTSNYWDHPMHQLDQSDRSKVDAALGVIAIAAETVLERHGINVNFALEDHAPAVKHLPLLAA